MKKIIRTDKGLHAFMTGNLQGVRFASVELRSWWNPMRLFFGRIYYTVV
jgi:hypothetical protein